MALGQTGRTACDVVIIGGGIIGLTTAYRLADADPTLRVVIISGPGGLHPAAASSAAGAMLGSVGEVDHQTLGSPLRRKKLELGLDAERRWAAWLPELSERGGTPAVTITKGTHVTSGTSFSRFSPPRTAAT